MMHYLDPELIQQLCHRLAMALFDTKEDPIAPFECHDRALLESALLLPAAQFNGCDLYPTLIEKATALYYSLNKNYPFQNGNKRIATIALVVFLYINGQWIDAGITEMTNMALLVAKSSPKDRQAVLERVRVWIQDHAISVPEDDSNL